MRFEIGQIVLLDKIEYLIKEKLGHGAVSDVYLAAPQAWSAAEVVIKLARDDAGPDLLKIEGLQREAEVLEVLNQTEDPTWAQLTDPLARLRRVQETALKRRVIALISSGQLAPDQPFVIQEKSPPAFERFSIENLADEQRMLTVIHALAEAMAMAHQHNLTLKDFEPQTKWDRIRVQWSEDQIQLDLKIIDWNITGGLDEKDQDFFFFGGHSYYFLLGYHLTLDLDNQPPVNLGVGMANWDRLTEGTRQILRRLLHRDPRRRYREASDIAADLAWWLETMRRANDPKAPSRLQDRIWQVRPQGRHDQALAAAELALHLDLSSETRRSFELWAKQAKEELEKEDWQPIAHARATLLTGAYDKATEEFGQQLRTLPPNSEAARLARLFQRLAQVGALLKKTYPDSDVRTAPEWGALNRVIVALIERRYEEAQQALFEVERLRPETANWSLLNELFDFSRAGLLLQEATSTGMRAQPRRADANQPDWIGIETQQIALLEQAVAQLREAQQLAPLEPEFQEKFRVEQGNLDRRHALLTRYQDVDKFTTQGQQAERQGQTGDLATDLKACQAASTAYEAALAELAVILQVDPAQYRAHLLQDRLQNTYQETVEQRDRLKQSLEIARRVDELLAQAQDYFRRARYDDALKVAREAADLAPDRTDVQVNLVEAKAGIDLLKQTSIYLEDAQKIYYDDNFDAVESVLDRLRSWSKPPAGKSVFRFPDEVHDEIVALTKQIRDVGEAYQQVQVYQTQGNYAAIVTLLETLKAHYPLTPKGEQWLTEAKERIRVQTGVSATLFHAGYEEIRTILASLEGDLSPRAAEIRREVSGRWYQLTRTETKLISLDEHLREGIALFQSLPVAETMAGMRGQVELAQTVVADLVVTEPDRWPAWFAEQDWLYRLRRLSDNLDILLKDPKSWPVLQELARGYYAQLAGYLDDFQCTQLNLARDKAKEDFKAAQRLAEAAQQISNLVWVKLSCLEQLKDFNKNIRSCIEIEEGLKKLNEDLDNNLSFTKAITRIDQLPPLPNHPDIPVDNPKAWQQAFRAGLSWGVETEKLLTDLPPADPTQFALAMESCLKRVEQSIEVLPVKRVGQLCLRCLNAVQQTARQLRRELEDANRTYESQSETSPQPLLQLYWQARWWQVRCATTSLVPESELADGLQSTRQLAIQLLNHIANAFVKVKNRSDLDQTQARLVNLITFNQGLARRPTGANFSALPLLPPGIDYDNLTSPLDSVALQQWITQVQLWQKLDDQAATQPTSDQLSSIRETVRQFQRSLRQLKQVWHTLGLGDWSNNTPSLTQLEAETMAYLDLVDAIQQGAQSIGDEEAKTKLNALNQEIDRIEQKSNQQDFSILATFELAKPEVEASQPFSLWLLSSHREVLRQKLGATRQHLGRQVYLAQQQQSLQSALASAQQALSQRQFESAREHFKQALEVVPDNVEAKAGLDEVNAREKQVYLIEGQRALDREDFQRARKAFEATLGIDPDNPKALAGLRQTNYKETITQGHQALREGKFEEAASYFQRAQEVNQGSNEANSYEYIAMGRQALATDNLIAAIDFFRRARNLDSNNVEAHSRLVETYLRAGQETQRKGRLRQAEEYFRAIVETIAPDHLEAKAELDNVIVLQQQQRQLRRWLISGGSVLTLIIGIVLIGWLRGPICLGNNCPTPTSQATPTFPPTPTVAQMVDPTLTPDTVAAAPSATSTQTATSMPTATSSPTPEPSPTPTFTLIPPTLTSTPIPILGQIQNENVAIYPDPITDTITLIIPQGETVYLCAQAGERYLVANTYCHLPGIEPLGWVSIRYIIFEGEFPEILITPFTPTPTLPPTPTPQPVTPQPTIAITAANLLTNGNIESQLTGWGCESCELMTSTTITHTGLTALAVTGRGAEWAGPSQSITTNAMTSGVGYNTEVWVKMNTGTANLKITLRVEVSNSEEPQIINLARPTLVNDTNWTKIANEPDQIILFEGEPVSIHWYVETEEGTADFYLDDAIFNLETTQ